ncbi:MAG: hypothetical protein PUE68_02665, partial [Kiritimatiellae bacterium]|nr:hypothetical protein [Kiritimatiellia bacterium]
MKKLTLALACASTLALFAADFSVATFEGGEEVLGKTVGGKTDAGGTNGDIYWQYVGASNSEDSSVVTAYGGENLPAPTGSQLSGTPGSNYLNLSTEGGTLWRSVNPNSANLGAEETITAAGIYVDTMVQFTATEGDDTPEVGSDDQIAIWLKSDGEGNTCLCVRAAQAHDTGTSSTFEPKTYVLADTGSVKAGQWYRLTVKAIADADQRMALNESYSTGITGFQIYLDGELLHTEDKTYTEGYMGLACDAGEWGWLTVGQDADDKVIALLESGSVFPSLKGEVTSATFQAVGFKGSGAIDDLKLTDENPIPPA